MGQFLTPSRCLKKTNFHKGNWHFYKRNCSTIFFWFWLLFGELKKKKEKRKKRKMEKKKMKRKGKRKNKRKGKIGKTKKEKEKNSQEKSKMKKNQKEKMKKWRKIKKCEISEYFSGFRFHTKNPWRFLGFAVVVTFFDDILDDFHIFSGCVFFRKKIKNQFGCFTVCPRKSYKVHWTWNKNTHFTDENHRFFC